MSYLLRAIIVSSCVLGACMAESTEETNTVEQQAGCSPLVCGDGSNSPEIDHKGFHMVGTVGQLNLEGFRLEVPSEHSESGKHYTIRVKHATVIAESTDGGPALTDTNGSTPSLFDDLGKLNLVITHTSGTKYVLRFTQQGRAPFWAKPGGAHYHTNTYLLEWVDAKVVGQDREWKNVCSNVQNADGHGTLGMQVHHVVVFEDEQIDAHAITVGAPAENWFNIGCAGHALSKLHLTGHTQAAQHLTSDEPVEEQFNTTIEERQTFLKMLAADYCGTGQPHTVAGHPLTWADSKEETMKYLLPAPGSENTLEAKWGPNGATCLNKPRADAHWGANYDGIFGYASMGDMLADTCKGQIPPPCKSEDPYDWSGEHIFSANPP